MMDLIEKGFPAVIVLCLIGVFVGATINLGPTFLLMPAIIVGIIIIVLLASLVVGWLLNKLEER